MSQGVATSSKTAGASESQKGPEKVWGGMRHAFQDQPTWINGWL